MQIIQIKTQFIDEESSEMYPEVKSTPVNTAAEAQNFLMKKIKYWLKQVGSNDIVPRFSRWGISLDTNEIAQDGDDNQYFIRKIGKPSTSPAAAIYVPGCEVDIKWYLVK